MLRAIFRLNIFNGKISSGYPKGKKSKKKEANNNSFSHTSD